MRSPVLTRALGECNAIEDRIFGHVELTLACTFETDFVNGRYCRRFARLTAHQPYIPPTTRSVSALRIV